MTTKVLVETAFPKLNIVEKEGEKPLRVSGVAAIADAVNGNGRVYPMKVLEREVNKLADRLDQSDHAGFVDHPTFDSSVSDIGLKFTRLWMEDKLVKFEAEIVDTAKGRDLAAVIKAGIRIGISSRGNGSIKRGMWDGVTANIVQDDFDLESYDAVVTPAVANARIVQYESKQKVVEALARIIEQNTANSPKSYISDVGSENTISENEMERTTEDLIKLVQQYLDAKSVVNIDHNPEDEGPREQTFADPADNPNEQPNPQPDPMNRDTSPLTHTTPNIPDVPINPIGDHPDPTMGAGAPNPNENNEDAGKIIGAPEVGGPGNNTIQSTGLNRASQRADEVAAEAEQRQANEVTSVEGEYKEPEKALRKKNDDPAKNKRSATDEDAGVRDMLQQALDRQTELAVQLRDAQNDAGVIAAIAALSTSISDHLNRGEWDMVSHLSSIAGTLSWYAKESSNTSHYDSLQKSRVVDSILMPVVKMAERVARDEMIDKKTADERYGRSIAARLRDKTRSAAEVETLFESVKDSVIRDATNGADLPGKGSPITDKKYTPEQQRLRELAGINED